MQWTMLGGLVPLEVEGKRLPRREQCHVAGLWEQSHEGIHVLVCIWTQIVVIPAIGSSQTDHLGITYHSLLLCTQATLPLAS